MSRTKKIFIAFGVLVLAFILLNFNYLWANGVFLLVGHKYAYRQGSTSGQTAVSLKEPNRLKIESLGIEAPVIYIQEKSEKAYQAALKDGVVHYPGTALPGRAGNCYIFGHSSDYLWSKGKYKSVFAVLPSVKKGDAISITDQEGSFFTYKVIGTFVVSADDLSVLNQNTQGKKLLTLQTSYPIGTALKRFVVMAELEK